MDHATEAADSRQVAVDSPPILFLKAHGEESVFQVENLLREGVVNVAVPVGPCLRSASSTPMGTSCDTSDPSVTHLHDGWSCYRSEMWVTRTEGIESGVVPCAVGASYAVLIAEQLAASGSRTYHLDHLRRAHRPPRHTALFRRHRTRPPRRRHQPPLPPAVRMEPHPAGPSGRARRRPRRPR